MPIVKIELSKPIFYFCGNLLKQNYQFIGEDNEKLFWEYEEEDFVTDGGNKQSAFGLTITETIGIGVINDYAVAKITVGQ